jgi:hypothetical protein
MEEYFVQSNPRSRCSSSGLDQNHKPKPQTQNKKTINLIINKNKKNHEQISLFSNGGR